MASSHEEHSNDTTLFATKLCILANRNPRNWKGVFVLYDSWKFVLYLYWTLLFLRKFLDYEKIDVRIQILKRHKLKPHHIYIVVTISVQKLIYEWPLNERHLVKQWLAEKRSKGLQTEHWRRNRSHPEHCRSYRGTLKDCGSLWITM